ncbi:hypothetical protein CEXT_25851 [Caerostris extrusa]|uniref:Uncharacterized protein n=1 Tax=Caerostris extrusa TaxID=172846 RepID=A0AAV4P8I0_CAEEX|nr:hypothetical protein CEXT_25851 [Caerostris extrusa]
MHTKAHTSAVSFPIFSPFMQLFEANAIPSGAGSVCLDIFCGHQRYFRTFSAAKVKPAYRIPNKAIPLCWRFPHKAFPNFTTSYRHALMLLVWGHSCLTEAKSDFVFS